MAGAPALTATVGIFPPRPGRFAVCTLATPLAPVANSNTRPAKVAEAILDAAITPTHDKKVGAMSLVNTMMSKLMPATGGKESKA